MVAARRILLSTLALGLAGGLLAAISSFNRLDSVALPAREDSTDVVLRFARRPEFLRVPLDNSLVLVLDFPDTIFTDVRQSWAPAAGPIRSLDVTQFDTDRVRMSLKLARRGRVEIFRHREEGFWALTLRVVPAEPASTAAASRPKLPDGPPVIVLDPGHGGKDVGARGRRHLEKDIALAIGLEAKAHFDKDPSIKAYLTRETDTFISLEHRSRFADRVGARVFVSIHLNSTRVGNPSGAEVYFLSLKGASNEQARLLAERENAADGEDADSGSSLLDQILMSMEQINSLNESSRLSEIVMRRLVTETNQRNRGIRQAGFKVLKPFHFPSILVEFGFISNRPEESLMGSHRYQAQAGRVLYESIREYLQTAGQL